MVRRHRPLTMDEMLAGAGLLIWIVMDVVTESMFGGANPDHMKIWSTRGVLTLVLIVAYALIRNRSQPGAEKA
jgi:hypothetical protein